MHPADGIILAIIAVSMLVGIFRGLVREAFSLAGWCAALVVARVFHGPFEGVLAGYIATPSVRMVVSYAGLFVATLLLSTLLGYMVMSLMEMAGVRAVDRLLGAVFGVVRGLILVLVLLVTVAPFTTRDPWWHDATLPKEFMRYESAGRELRDSVMHAAGKAGQEAHAGPATDAATDSAGQGPAEPAAAK